MITERQPQILFRLFFLLPVLLLGLAMLGVGCVRTVAGRTHIEGWPPIPVLSIAEVIERTVQIGALTNPGIRCAGISVNTSSLPPEERAEYLARLAERYALPVIDPMLTGTAAILDNL